MTGNKTSKSVHVESCRKMAMLALFKWMNKSVEQRCYWRGYWLTVRHTWFDPLHVQEIYLFSKAFRPLVGPTQRLLNVYRGLFPREQGSRGVKLTVRTPPPITCLVKHEWSYTSTFEYSDQAKGWRTDESWFNFFYPKAFRAAVCPPSLRSKVQRRPFLWWYIGRSIKLSTSIR